MSERVNTSPGLLIGSQIQGTSGPTNQANPPNAVIATLVAAFNPGKPDATTPERSLSWNEKSQKKLNMSGRC